MNTRIEGKIHKLFQNPDKHGMRIGSIRSEDNREWFFNQRNLAADADITALEVGTRISFRPDPRPPLQGKSPVAIDIRLSNSAQPTRRQETPPRNTSHPASQSAFTSSSEVPIPYTFVPVSSALAISDSPVAHDGSQDEPLWSGEILVTLTALTPLLVGNQQHKIDEKHSRMEPLCLDDGRVAIAATSLKGMLRGTLDSLLAAPMSRVSEHVYTYRPNLGFEKKPRFEVRPAVVTEVDGESVKVKLLKSARAAVFVREEAYRALDNPAPGEHLTGLVPGVAISTENDKSRLVQGGSNPLDHIVLTYRGGIDGEGKLAEAFRPGNHTYNFVLVPLAEYTEAEVHRIDKATLDAYRATQRALADTQCGHLARGYPLKDKISEAEVAKAISGSTELQPNQLIYVEYKPGDLQAPKGRIVSLGHHFLYRWRYADSVRLRSDGSLRDEIAQLADEHPATDETQAPPIRLSAGRLLFGYADDERANSDPKRPPFGKGDFARSAGRISPNMAVEIPREDGLPRFLNDGGDIQFRVLGQPRPSAVEFYLQQTNLPRKLTTYGELPGEKGGQLAGRKHYRHQPDAAAVPRCYQAQPGQHDQSGERGTIARHVSAPGVRFRFTLRFAHLREWELGALLCALDPEQLDTLYGGLHANAQGKGPRFAHKLGYGRPLGLGSVNLTADRLRLRRENQFQFDEVAFESDITRAALAAFKDKLGDGTARTAHLQRWLRVLAYRGESRAAYPMAKAKVDGKLQQTIFAWHTNLRRAHAKARRSQQPVPFTELDTLLKR